MYLLKNYTESSFHRAGEIFEAGVALLKNFLSPFHFSLECNGHLFCLQNTRRAINNSKPITYYAEMSIKDLTAPGEILIWSNWTRHRLMNEDSALILLFKSGRLWLSKQYFDEDAPGIFVIVKWNSCQNVFSPALANKLQRGFSRRNIGDQSPSCMPDTLKFKSKICVWLMFCSLWSFLINFWVPNN